MKEQKKNVVIALSGINDKIGSIHSVVITVDNNYERKALLSQELEDNNTDIISTNIFKNIETYFNYSASCEDINEHGKKKVVSILIANCLNTVKEFWNQNVIILTDIVDINDIIVHFNKNLKKEINDNKKNIIITTDNKNKKTKSAQALANILKGRELKDLKLIYGSDIDSDEFIYKRKEMVK